jgi:hypothetical protein
VLPLALLSLQVAYGLEVFVVQVAMQDFVLDSLVRSRPFWASFLCVLGLILQVAYGLEVFVVQVAMQDFVLDSLVRSRPFWASFLCVLDFASSLWPRSICGPSGDARFCSRLFGAFSVILGFFPLGSRFDFSSPRGMLLDIYR